MSEWKTVRLGELFELQMGKTPDRKRLDYFGDNGNKWISIADISKADKYITETKECITDEAVNNRGIKQIPAKTTMSILLGFIFFLYIVHNNLRAMIGYSTIIDTP